MEKTYETYAKRFYELMEAHERDVKEIENEANKVAVDKRRSDFGRQEHVDNLKRDLGKLNAEISETLRGLVNQFCNEYDVNFAEDGKDHTTEIANALKIIDMCGVNITADLFRSAIEPLKGSYKALKMINDVLSIKWEKHNANTPEQYNPEIREIIYDYLGTNEDVNSFVGYMNDVKAILEYPTLVNYQLVNTGINGVTRFEVQNCTRYSVGVLPDEIIRLGKMYETLSLKYPLLFSKYIPTAKDIVDDTANNQG